MDIRIDAAQSLLHSEQQSTTVIKVTPRMPGDFPPVGSTASISDDVHKLEIESIPLIQLPAASISQSNVRYLRKRTIPEPCEDHARHPPKRFRRGESDLPPATIIKPSRKTNKLRRSATGQSTDERLPTRPPGMLSKNAGPNVTVRHGPLPRRSSLGPYPIQPMVLRDSALWKRRRLPNSEEQPRVKRPKLNVFKDVQPPPPVMTKVKPLRSALRPLKRIRFDSYHITPVVKVKALRHPVLEVEAWAGGPAAAGLLVSDLEKRFDQGKKARSRIVSVPSTKVADELEMRKRSWAEDLYDSHKVLRGVSGAFALSAETAFVDHQVTTPSVRPPVASSTSGEVVPTDATGIDHTEVDGQATMDDSKNFPTGDRLNRSVDDNPASTKDLPYIGGITLVGSSDGFEAGGKEMDPELGDEDIWTGCDDSYDYTALMDALADNSISPETAAKFIKGYGLVIPADLEDTLSINLHVVST